MLKSLFRLAVIAVIGLIIYNYFMGTPEEKESSREIIEKVKDVGASVKDVLKSEKEKFDEGKYDEALDKISGLFNKMKSRAEEVDPSYLEEITKLEERHRDLERRFRKLDEYDNTEFAPKGDNNAETEQLKKEMEELVEKTRRVIDDMNEKQ